MISINAVAQKATVLDSTVRQALLIAERNSTFGNYYFVDSFSKVGDSVNAGITLQKVSPYYLWYEHSVHPGNIDSFLQVKYLLSSGDRAQYKKQFDNTFNKPKSGNYLKLKAYHDEDVHMRALSDDCGSEMSCLAVMKARMYADSLHAAYLFDYVKRKGWPSLAEGSMYAAVLAIHDHRNHAFYLPFIKEAVLNGDLPLSLYELMSLWNYNDIDDHTFIKHLRTREYRKIDISTILNFDREDLYKLSMPSDTVLALIAEAAKQLCPVDYYFSHEMNDRFHDTWWEKYQYKPGGGEINKIQKLIFDNTCYDAYGTNSNRDALAVYYNVYTVQCVPPESATDKLYLYLVSYKPKVQPVYTPGVQDTFSVFFETDKSELDVFQQVRLQSIVTDSIRINDSVRIEGYADNTGEDNDNFKLSERRAVNIRTYLEANGVEKAYITGHMGKGAIKRSEEETVAREDRRVDIIIRRN